ncbi:uncharacterized protein [Amphiura filiformis]|uniref:uncharacterized protein n=1 Tax=Amphiura filiformis TaxID=82378 RepID=UPI003B2282FF
MSNSIQATNRVLLWTVGRSLSTVFTKCLSFVDGIQIINEPHNAANSCGPERLRDDGSKIQAIFDAKVAKTSATPSNGYDVNISTYDWVKTMLEADYPGKQIVFCKDFAFALRERYSMIPEGYRHTFLIRDPRKVFSSFKKLWVKLLQDDSFQYHELPPYLMNPPKLAFGELYELYQYVQSHGLETNPIIIDADDLQRDPGSVLSQYCKAVGIPYADGLLEWEAGAGVVDTWKLANIMEQANKLEEGGFYDTAFSSTHFSPPSDPPTRDEIDDDLLPLIDKAMVFYDSMYAARIKPE